MSTIASHSPLNISETVRDRGLIPKDYQQEMSYGESNGQVTPKDQNRDHNTLREQYLEISLRCSSATIANYYLVCYDAV